MAWIDTLIPATYNGFPFQVEEAERTIGRRVYDHTYVGRDDIYPEDLGRAKREYTFNAYLVGDDSNAQAEAFQLLLELPGPGILTHPSHGIVRVQLRSCSIGISKEQGRKNVFRLSFVEATPLGLFASILNTALAVVSFAQDFSSSSSSSFAANTSSSNVTNASTISAAQLVTNLATDIVTYSSDSTRWINATNGIGFIFNSNNVTFGRYSNGNLTSAPPALSAIPNGLSVPDKAAAAETALIDAANTTIQAIATSAGAVTALLAPLTGDTATLTSAVNNLFETFRSNDADPSDAIRLITQIVTNLQTSDVSTNEFTEQNVLSLTDAYGAMCRQQGLYSIALACSNYQPLSSNDANNIISQVTDLFDYEINFTGNIGDDQTFNQLRILRSAIVNDLKTRSATLPELITITRKASLPAAVIANELYGDGSRGDEIVNRNNSWHPFGVQLTLECLSS